MQSEIAVQENIDPRNVKANLQAREAEAMGPHGQQRMASVQRHNLDPRNLHASQQAKLAANHGHNGSGNKKEKEVEIQKKREEFVQRVDYDLARTTSTAAL